MSILSFLQAKNKNQGSFYVLDIGDHSVKCLIVKNDQANTRVDIMGYAVEDLVPGDVSHGQIVNIHPVVEKTAQAIDKAIYLAGFKPEYAIACISGPDIISQINTISHTRKNPKSKITTVELSQILSESQKQIKKEILNQKNSANDIELINASVLNTNIDKVAVKNPLDFIGQNLEFKLFSSFAPLIQINALQSVVDNLKINLITSVYHPFALYRSLYSTDANTTDAIIIDIGEHLTNLLIINDKSLEYIKTINQGAGIFSELLSANLEVNLIKANQYKIDYSQNFLSDETSNQISKLFFPEIAKFNLKLINSIRKSKLSKLPTHVYFTGGGALLPGIIDDFYKQFHKFHKSALKPIILDLKNFENIYDHTTFIKNTIAIPSLAVAKLGVQFGDYDSTISNIIKKFYQTLRN